VCTRSLWRLGVDPRNRETDFVDLAARAGRGDLGAAMPSNYQAAGIDIRQIIAAGPRGRSSGRSDLPHRNRLAGEQRFIAFQIMRREHGRVGRHAVTFGENDKVAAHNLGAGNAFLHAGDRPAIIPGNVRLSQTQTAAERLTIVTACEIAAEGRLTTDFILREGYVMGKFD
jgi:hypothetical protein